MCFLMAFQLVYKVSYNVRGYFQMRKKQAKERVESVNYVLITVDDTVYISRAQWRRWCSDKTDVFVSLSSRKENEEKENKEKEEKEAKEKEEQEKKEKEEKEAKEKEEQEKKEKEKKEKEKNKWGSYSLWWVCL